MDGHHRRTLRSGDIVHDEHGNPLRLDMELGTGGQGTVWSVESTKVAVKVVRGTRDSGSAAALQARLRAVSRLDLSGIPIARPYAMLRDHTGYVMELLADMTGMSSLVRPAQDLAMWYQDTGGLRRRLRLLATTAQALSRLHGRAIAYGDVSPSNVLVSDSGLHDQVWLIDPDNLTLVTGTSGYVIGTPGYEAPEVAARRSGISTLTDAFAFAVLAFHVLVLAHPFKGDLVLADAEREPDAFAGKLPWIDDLNDDRNRTTGGFPRPVVLTPGLTRLFRRAFEDGLHEPAARPPMAEWCEKLDAAALATIPCTGCPGTYYAPQGRCPWCGTARPRLARCDIHASAPPPTGDPDFQSRLETDRLVGIVVTAGEPVVIRARNGLVSLDPGPGREATAPEEPLAELAWDGVQVRVRRTGRHPVWLADPDGERGRQLRAGEWMDLPQSRAGRWTVRFGPPGQVHRFARFLVAQGVA